MTKYGDYYRPHTVQLLKQYHCIVETMSHLSVHCFLLSGTMLQMCTHLFLLGSIDHLWLVHYLWQHKYFNNDVIYQKCKKLIAISWFYTFSRSISALMPSSGLLKCWKYTNYLLTSSQWCDITLWCDITNNNGYSSVLLGWTVPLLRQWFTTMLVYLYSQCVT